MRWLLATVLVTALVLPLLVSGKEQLEVISDAKEFKKVLRLRKNVLFAFTKQAKAVPRNVLAILETAAKDAYGIGSIYLVDCGASQESRKLCKKQRADPADWGELVHYKDGELHKRYDRQLTAKSIFTFLKDPTADAPWEEDPIARDVVHLASPKDLHSLVITQSQPALVMFYVPWCGFCKKLKPEFAQAATEVKRVVTLAAMDVDQPENYAVRQQFNITGFPTLFLISKNPQTGSPVMLPYGGENSKEGILSWLKSPTPPKEKQAEPAWKDDEASAVLHITDDSFDEAVVHSGIPVLVMFHAPWCGHCKRMKPEFEAAARRIQAEFPMLGTLAAVDATSERKLAEQFHITGYPTVKYFKNGDAMFDMTARSADEIIKFLQDPKAPPPPEPAWDEQESHVVHLTAETFAPTLKRKKHALVMFYAPWCQHCKRAKPHFQDAASQFAEWSKVLFGAVDCTKHSELCTEHAVQGYPTLLTFTYGAEPAPFSGGRETKDFVNFMQTLSGLQPHAAAAPGDAASTTKVEL